MSSMEDRFSLVLSQEEGILLLTSARLLDKLVAGVTIHAQERDELIREIIDKLSLAVTPALASMSDELADAIMESVLGCEDGDDDFLCPGESPLRDFVEASGEGSGFNYPMYSVDKTLPQLENALVNHCAVRTKYYSFARESVDELTLNPLSIIREEGMWRVVAYCHEKDDVMIFRVDRIKELDITADHFEMPSDFNHGRQAAFTAYC